MFKPKRMSSLYKSSHKVRYRHVNSYLGKQKLALLEETEIQKALYRKTTDYSKNTIKVED